MPMFFVFFSLFFRIVHPVKMVLGFAAISVAFGGYVYGTNNQWQARQFKRNHPLVSVLIILAAGYLVVYMFGAVIVFMFGIAFPLLCKYVQSMKLITTTVCVCMCVCMYACAVCVCV